MIITLFILLSALPFYHLLKPPLLLYEKDFSTNMKGMEEAEFVVEAAKIHV